MAIDSGECVAIVGEEGSGKSTLLQLLDGLQKPDSGSVFVDRQDIWRDAKTLQQLRKRIGFAFQFPEQQFFCETVYDELIYASRNFGLSSDSLLREAQSLFADLGLHEKLFLRSPFSLSMGEARRVALASIVVHQPDAFLLDEPTAGLDGFGFDDVKSLLLRLKSQSKTIFFASHDVELIGSVASRVLVLANGKMGDDMPVAEYLRVAITANV